MGLDQSSLKPSQYNEKKRQSHSILGQITLIQDVSTLHLFTKKCLKLPVSQVPKTLLCDTSNRNFLTIKEIVKQAETLLYCSSEEMCSVIFDCTEVDLQSIQTSKFFHRFREQDLLNIVLCVLDGLIMLSSHRLGVFPICKKSIFIETTKDQYLGEDLSKVIFKILPLEFTRSEQIKEFMTFCIIPPELQNSFEILKQDLYLQYSPKSQIYCLGMMLLDLISDQQYQQKRLDFSFGNPNCNPEAIYSNLNHQFSNEFMDMCRLMVINEEEERIGMTCLSQMCRNLIKNKSKHATTKKEESFGKSIEARSKTQRKTRRTISSVGLTHRESDPLAETLEIKTKSKSKILADLTNNVQTLHQKDKPNMGFKTTPIIKTAQQRVMGVPQEIKGRIRLQKGRLQQIKFKNGAFYEGQLDSNNNFNGFGTLFYTQKQICYTGYWKNNYFHGFGYLFNNKHKCQNTLLKKNTEIDYLNLGETQDKTIGGDYLWEHYEGQFKNDLKEGYGILFFLDGSKFEGQFISGKANGTGTFVRKNGDLIYGLWKNHKLVKKYH